MATSTPSSDPKTISLKLLVNKCTNKVMFAEAGKDFVDFILCLLTMPLGSIVEVLKNEMVGSLGKLHGSLELLCNTFMQPHVEKDVLLHPCPSAFSQNLLLLQAEDTKNSSSEPKYYYTCSNDVDHNYVSNTRGMPCPSCDHRMNIRMELLSSRRNAMNKENVEESVGFVKEVVTYMIMDDLAISPMSSISSITLINKFGVRDIGSLDEKMVTVGFDEGRKLLKASLQSSTVLTDVFMK